MTLFHSVTFTWWQVGIFKLSVLAFGIVIGAYWNEFFTPYVVPLLVIAVVAGLYIAYLWFKR